MEGGRKVCAQTTLTATFSSLSFSPEGLSPSLARMVESIAPTSTRWGRGPVYHFRAVRNQTAMTRTKTMPTATGV